MAAVRGKRPKANAMPHRCPHPPMLNATDGVRLLMLALEGLDGRTKFFDLDGEDVQREIGPMMLLCHDILDALKRRAA